MSKVAAQPGGSTAGGEGQDREKRRQILDGAREVFRAKGYEGASMDAIAKAGALNLKNSIDPEKRGWDAVSIEKLAA